MAWPINPSVGDTYTTPGGNQYVYTVHSTWKSKGNVAGLDASSIATGVFDDARFPAGLRSNLTSVVPDNVLAKGIYYIPYSTGVSPAPPVNGSWFLEHLSLTDDANGPMRQRAFPEKAEYGTAWLRWKLAGVWTAWERTYATASEINALITSAISTKISSSEKGAANGVATLDGAGKVPSAQLPSFVDDVLEAANTAAFPATGEVGKIYVALDTGRIYRWSGSTYVEIVPAPGSTDSVSEGSLNLYFTEARVRAAVLTGLSTASSAAATATDSILTAIGKLQGQANLITSKAPIASPALTGTPTAPTATAGTNTTQIATTAFVTTGLAAKADTAHTHSIADVTSLQTTLDSKLPLTGGTLTGRLALYASTAASSSMCIPHGVAPTTPVNGDVWTTTSGLYVRINGVTRAQYDDTNLPIVSQTDAETGTATAARVWTAQRVRQAIVAAPIGTLTQAALDAKAAASHTHAIADVTGLQAALDAKSATGHIHAIADITNLQTTLDAKATLASPTFTGVPAAPTATAGTNTTQIATTAFVTTGLATKANTSHAHAISDITGLQTALDAKSPIASPSFTGTPVAPTATAGTNTTQIATTAFVVTAIASKANSTHTHAISDVTNLQTSLDAKAPIASPTFTGVPAAPTASAGTNTTQLATTAFVTAAIGTLAPATHSHVIGDITGLQTALDGKAASTHTHVIADTTGLQAALDAKLPLAGGTLTGKLRTVAPAAGYASVTLPHGTAPTTLVDGDVWTTTSGMYVRVNGGTRTVYDTSTLGTISQAEAEAGTATTARAWTAERVKQAIVAGPVGTATQTALNLKANLASPALTGTPTAPTPATSDNSTTLATTAYVKSVIATTGGNVSTQATAPTSPLLGDMWFNTADEILYMYTSVGTGNIWLDISSSTLASGGSGSDIQAWVRFYWNGTTVVILAHKNVSSVTRDSSDLSYTVNFATPLADGLYAMTGSVSQYPGDINQVPVFHTDAATDYRPGAFANANSCRVGFENRAGGYNDPYREACLIFVR